MLLQISVNGKPLASQKPKQLYFALNKPKGYICSSTASDNAQQTPRLAVDLFEDWIQRQRKAEKAVPPRLFTVGRLDVQSTGLILVTNDGMHYLLYQDPQKPHLYPHSLLMVDA